MWKFENSVFTDKSIGKNIGFVYMIINKESGKFYIGKKVFFFVKKTKISKKEKKETGTRKVYKYNYTDSGWKDYWGSGEYLKKDLELYGEKAFSRIILKLCRTKKQMSYFEIKYQFVHGVLEIDSYNESINGVFFRKDLENSEE